MLADTMWGVNSHAAFGSRFIRFTFFPADDFFRTFLTRLGAFD